MLRWYSSGCAVGADQPSSIHFVYYSVMPGYSLCLRLPDIQPCVSGETVSIFSLHLLTSAQYSLVPITNKSWVPRCDDTGWNVCQVLWEYAWVCTCTVAYIFPYGLGRDSIAWQLSLVCPQSPCKLSSSVLWSDLHVYCASAVEEWFYVYVVQWKIVSSFHLM